MENEVHNCTTCKHMQDRVYGIYNTSMAVCVIDDYLKPGIHSPASVSKSLIYIENIEGIDTVFFGVNNLGREFPKSGCLRYEHI